MTIEDEIKQTKFKNPYQKAVLNLIFTANWIQNKQKELFEPFGITGQQYNILRILRGQHPGAISAAEIKTRMLDKNSDVSRLLDRLKNKKLIRKNQCADDRRASDVTISDAGLLLLKELDAAINNLDKRLLNLSTEDALLLSSLLDKIRS
jgi:DNA-binding MarR family transcriptional regulator